MIVFRRLSPSSPLSQANRGTPPVPSQYTYPSPSSGPWTRLPPLPTLIHAWVENPLPNISLRRAAHSPMFRTPGRSEFLSKGRAHPELPDDRGAEPRWQFSATTTSPRNPPGRSKIPSTSRDMAERLGAPWFHHWTWGFPTTTSSAPTIRSIPPASSSTLSIFSAGVPLTARYTAVFAFIAAGLFRLGLPAKALL